MKRKPFLNQSETRTLDLLERSLYGSGLEVYVKPRLTDVLMPDPGEALNDAEKRMLRFGHLDFLIVNRTGGAMPIFALEFDGPGHDDPVQAARDIAKNDLCRRAELPLLRFHSNAITEREQITVLEWQVERLLAFRTECADLIKQRFQFREWSDIIDNHDLPEAERAAVRREERAYHDKAEAFSMRHPFRPIDALLERLETRFGIGPFPYLTLGEPPPPDPTTPYLLQVESIGMTDTHIPMRAMILRTKGEQVIHHAAVDVRLVNQDIESRWLVTEVTGGDPWDVEATVGQYLLLVSVYRWADRTLVRLDQG